MTSADGVYRVRYAGGVAEVNKIATGDDALKWEYLYHKSQSLKNNPAVSSDDGLKFETTTNIISGSTLNDYCALKCSGTLSCKQVANGSKVVGLRIDGKSANSNFIEVASDSGRLNTWNFNIIFRKTLNGYTWAGSPLTEISILNFTCGNDSSKNNFNVYLNESIGFSVVGINSSYFAAGCVQYGYDLYIYGMK